ncbi:MAG TPA: hypothetical protein VM888_11205 [Chitinophagaceae bacterium]|nr:hypothetical protein [Chitinophagaceae bacterium]
MEERIWNTSLLNDTGRRKSELCKAKDLQTEWYSRWCTELKEEHHIHRKQWEYIFILQSLWERGCIGKGKRGLGFAVGTEPLPSLFASYGCEIVATDIHPEKGTELGWTDANQLCFGVESLNTRGLCPQEDFEKLVQYRPVDMNAIPDDLTGFDFTWSSCSFEHLGTIQKGIDFLINQLKTLKPGGWAVHTTEFNISSNDQTLDDANTVIFRRKDVEQVAAEVMRLGHFMEELDYSLGGLPEDFHVDIFPYKSDVHLRLQINEYVATSIGIIIQKKEKKGFMNKVKSKW